MNPTEIRYSRLLNHGISTSTVNNPEDVVRHMGAIQAQDYKQALWAIGVRIPSATVADVENEITKAKIVRTWSQRGTIHFIPAADTKWMLGLCASRTLAWHGQRMKQLNLTEAIMDRSEAIIKQLLEGGKRLFFTCL